MSLATAVRTCKIFLVKAFRPGVGRLSIRHGIGKMDFYMSKCYICEYNTREIHYHIVKMATFLMNKEVYPTVLMFQAFRRFSFANFSTCMKILRYEIK